MSELKRIGIMVLSIFSGSGVTAAFVWFNPKPPDIPNPFGGRPIETPQGYIWFVELSVIFWGSIYQSAAGLYRWFGEHEEGRQVTEVAGQHLPLLHLVGGLGLLGLHGDRIVNRSAVTVDLVMATIGALLTLLAFYECIQAIRRKPTILGFRLSRDDRST